MSARATLGPAVAGSWYPAAPEALGSLVDGFLRGAGSAAGAGEFVGVIAPHAGFVYSGAVAGRGFGLVPRGGWRRVVLVGPSHYAGFRGGCVPEADACRTPLGEVGVDRDAVRAATAHPALTADDRPFLPEHSLESELPFLQRHLEPGWRLLPVLIGSGSSWEDNGRVADALRPLVDADTLLVVSSDFTHYGPRFGYVPFDRDVPERIRRLDMGAVRHVTAIDRAGLHDYIERTGATICGRAAIDVLLALLGEGAAGELVTYDTSGRMTGDWNHSVSYASLVFRRGG